VQDALGQFIGKSFSGVGSIKTLAAIGVSIAQDGTLSLNTDTLNTKLATNPDDVRTFFTTNTKNVVGRTPRISTSTLLSNLTTSTFPAGHISITDGFGTVHDIDLSTGLTTVGQVIDKINSGTGGKVTAGNQQHRGWHCADAVGGSGTAVVAEVGGGIHGPAVLNIKGSFVNGILKGPSRRRHR